jgi:hypothetical protein
MEIGPVQFKISNFGFEILNSSNFKIPRFRPDENAGGDKSIFLEAARYRACSSPPPARWAGGLSRHTVDGIAPFGVAQTA